jgi:pyruvate dehydrogenase E1 component
MFGFQRIGDLMWLAGDIRAKGFLLGATYGRTTLNGEGLQHQDGHSLLAASTIPTIYAYDAAFGYEVTTIIADGLRRMYGEGEEIFYYLTLYNEKYPMPPMPEGATEGILKGLYKFRPAPAASKLRAQIFGSGPIINEALKAQTLLAEKYGVAADVWSATNYKWLRNDALNAQRWNLLHPGETPRKAYVETILEPEPGPFIAVSDNMKIVPDQIAPWVPGGLTTLGTDGFGRSDTRAHLRRFFEVDAEMITLTTLNALAKRGALDRSVAAQAIKDLKIDPEKTHPSLL